MIIDTHAHLYWDLFKDDLDEVVKRAIDADIKIAINVGVDAEKSLQAALMDSSNLKLYSTIGIHPHDALQFAADPNIMIKAEILKLEDIYYQYPQKIIAVGECGLDYFFENNPDFNKIKLTFNQIKMLQKRLFSAQIDLAKKLNFPIIVHCRDDRTNNPQNSECWDDCLEALTGSKGILHCYSGLEQTTKKALGLNFLFSFASTITYPSNEYLKQALSIIPLEKIVLETDCPFLPPQSKRGQRNEPANIVETAKMVAEIKNIPFEKVAEQTTSNAKKVFKIP